MLNRWCRGLRIAGAAAAVFCLGAAPPVQSLRVAGKLDGTETLLNPAWVAAAEASSHGYTFREPSGTVPAAARKPVAYLPKEVCVVALASAPQPAANHTIRIAGGRAAPATLVVAPGAQLTFENGDPFQHSLFGVGQTTFGAEPMLPGATRKWSVPSEGVFEIRDQRAPSVRVWVVAEPRVAAVAFPKTSGEFELALESPGTYSVQAYFSGHPVGEPQGVAIEGRNVTLKKNLDVRSPAESAAAAPKEQK